MTSPRLSFANSLRGIAALSVLLWHYVLTFESIKGHYYSFDAVPFQIYPAWLTGPLSSVPTFQFGAFGVALFFLISGLVIPFSVRGMAKAPLGRVAFVLARVMRIVPTYAVGAAISVGALYFGAYFHSDSFPLSAHLYFANISLFRDWTGIAQFDGVVWTLEAESKFYVFVLVAWPLLLKRKLLPLALLAVAAVMVSPLRPTYPVSWIPPSNFVWTFKYLAFMSIGVVLNYHYAGALTWRKALGASTALLGAFVSVCAFEGLALDVIGSYVTAAILFGLTYAFCRNWSGGPVLRFFADISFPLYAVHAPIGYVCLRLLIGRGWNGLEALALVVPIVIVIAWAMHVLIEVRSQELGKRAARAVQRAFARTHPDERTASRLER